MAKCACMRMHALTIGSHHTPRTSAATLNPAPPLVMVTPSERKHFLLALYSNGSVAQMRELAPGGEEGRDHAAARRRGRRYSSGWRVVPSTQSSRVCCTRAAAAERLQTSSFNLRSSGLAPALSC